MRAGAPRALPACPRILVPLFLVDGGVTMSAKPEELLDTAAAKEYQSGLQEYLLQHKINNAFSNIFDGLAVDLPDDPIPYIARLLKSRYPREMRHWNHPDIDGYVTPPPEEDGGEAGDDGDGGDDGEGFDDEGEEGGGEGDPDAAEANADAKEAGGDASDA